MPSHIHSFHLGHEPLSPLALDLERLNTRALMPEVLSLDLKLLNR